MWFQKDIEVLTYTTVGFYALELCFTLQGLLYGIIQILQNYIKQVLIFLCMIMLGSF
jgi:hypothetical protein